MDTESETFEKLNAAYKRLLQDDAPLQFPWNRLHDLKELIHKYKYSRYFIAGLVVVSLISIFVLYATVSEPRKDLIGFGDDIATGLPPRVYRLVGVKPRDAVITGTLFQPFIEDGQGRWALSVDPPDIEHAKNKEVKIVACRQFSRGELRTELGYCIMLPTGPDEPVRVASIRDSVIKFADGKGLEPSLAKCEVHGDTSLGGPGNRVCDQP